MNNLSVRARRHHRSRALLIPVAALSLGLAACQSPPTRSADSTADRIDVTLQFDGEFASQPFDCNSRFDAVGSGSTSVSVSDYRLFVSGVALVDGEGNATDVTLEDDGRWQYDNVALLDFEDGSGACSNGTAEVRDVVVGSVPAGEYVGVRFEVGVPFELNHADPTLAASPLNLTALFWNWRGGYRFMRVDLTDVEMPAMDTPSMQTDSMTMESEPEPRQPQTSGKASEHASGHGGAQGGQHGGAHGAGGGWALHLGSTGCIAESPTAIPSRCEHGNRVAVTLDEFDVDTQRIVIDPARVLSEVDVSSNTPGTSPGCMSAADDPECSPVLRRLGLVDGAGDQALMRVR